MYEQINENVGLDYEQIAEAHLSSDDGKDFIIIGFKSGKQSIYEHQDALDIKKWLKDFSDFMAQFKRKV